MGGKPRRIAVSAEGWVPAGESLHRTGAQLRSSSWDRLRKSDVGNALYTTKKEVIGNAEKRRITVIVERIP